MTDPLDDLKNAFSKATPAADDALKAANLARAQEIFEKMHGAAQGSTNESRLTSDRPRFGADLFRGARLMFAKLTSRQGLTATTALIAVGMVAMIPILQNGPQDVGFGRSDSDETLSARPIDVDTRVEPDVVVTEEAEIVPGREFNTLGTVEPAVSDLIAEDAGLVEESLPMPMVEMMVPARPAITNAPKVIGQSGFMNSPASGGLLSGPANDSSARRIAPPEPVAVPPQNTENFATEAPNPVKIVSEDPVSTFSIDVDTASYSVVRSSLMNGSLPNPDAVRIEEMINYFPYEYAGPEGDDGPFKPTVSVTPTPWNADTQLMHIAIQGEMPAVEDRPPLNLVFLIDTSGSMAAQNKLPLLKQSFRLMLGQLSPEDEVSIVTYAGSAGLVLEATPASERATILAALERLGAGGSTAGQAGLQQAYATAESMTEEGQVTRVILATDGDFNVGINSPDDLKEFIADKRDTGTYLSVLGFGRGNLDDALMQALAQNGNGQAAYIDTLSEAQKVLVDQLTGALFPIANDVKIQVEFNPNTVAEYRLIGYETRALAREDFNNDAVDAGEIGAGHSVTAIYEVTPVGSPAILNDPLRYSAVEDDVSGANNELAFLRLRYKTPGAETSQLIEIPVTRDMGDVSSDGQFAAAIASFGQLLQNSTYTGDWSFGDAVALAEESIGADPYGYRREAVTLMRLAQSLSE